MKSMEKRRINKAYNFFRYIEIHLSEKLAIKVPLNNLRVFIQEVTALKKQTQIMFTLI